jgi:hypothetical protein
LNGLASARIAQLCVGDDNELSHECCECDDRLFPARDKGAIDLG